MKLKIGIWFLVCFFGFGFQITWAEWYPGIIHAHSTFSDGRRNPTALVSRAKQSNTRFLIVTDHYELIESPYIKFPYIPVPFKKDHGFDNYRDSFSKLASSDFVIITGAEITSHWDDADSHLLALGDLAFADRELIRLQGQKDTQQAVIDRVNDLELLSVAAHPSLTALRYVQWRSDFKNYQFDPVAKGFKGIEFFNDEPEGYSRTRDLWYLMRLGWGDDIFVTSGCDSHWPEDVYDEEHWRKKTWVWSEKLDKESLLQAMGQGQTYAANDGAYFEKLNYLPKFEFQEVDQPKFEFTVAFDPTVAIGAEFYPGPAMVNIPVRIYRNGTLVLDSVRTYQRDLRNRQKLDYSWTDEEVKAGEHWYVIEVEGVLITSPIRLKIRTKPLTIGKILFVSYRDRNYEIYVMNPDGSGQTNLTRNPAGDWSPAWSPDGTKIAFISNRDGNYEIYVMNPDGSGQTNLSRNPARDGDNVSWGAPVWSPDGTKIVFWSNGELHVMNADGSGQTRLILPYNLYYWDNRPIWSPDRTKITFESHRDGNQEIYVMNEDGSGLTNLTRNPGWDAYPAWSPDGTKIAFISKRDGDNEIYVMNADGSGQTRLTRNSDWGGMHPAWSSNGTKIAFASWRDRKLDIHVMNADGSGSTNLTRNPEWDENPVWSPR